jgi:biopolymer transport protein ExbB
VEYWFHKLGILGYPLLLCSVLVLAIVIERLFFFLSLKSLPKIDCKHIQEALLENKDPTTCPHLKPRRATEAIHLLFQHKGQSKAGRDEILSYWLSTHRPHIFARLKWLNLLAVISPMLGLLGTVLGLILAFRAMAEYSGTINPSILADGLWNAMLTTAFGLIIALPALIFAQIYRFWGERYLEKLTATLNMLSFSLEGVRLKDK